MSMNGGSVRRDWAATCEVCEWSASLRNEQEGRIVIVLHMLTRHPERYLLITGKDPDIARLEYHDLLVTYRKEL